VCTTTHTRRPTAPPKLVFLNTTSKQWNKALLRVVRLLAAARERVVEPAVASVWHACPASHVAADSRCSHALPSLTVGSTQRHCCGSHLARSVCVTPLGLMQLPWPHARVVEIAAAPTLLLVRMRTSRVHAQQRSLPQSRACCRISVCNHHTTRPIKRPHTRAMRSARSAAASFHCGSGGVEKHHFGEGLFASAGGGTQRRAPAACAAHARLLEGSRRFKRARHGCGAPAGCPWA
jgi:hypothetical protein